MKNFDLQKSIIFFTLNDIEKKLNIIKAKSKYSYLINWDRVQFKINNNDIINFEPIIIFPLINVDIYNEIHLTLNNNYIDECKKNWWEDNGNEIENCFREQLDIIKDDSKKILDLLKEDI